MGNLLKEKRNEANLSPIEIAKKIGVEKITINQYEAKKRVPKPEILIKYTKILGITTDEYYNWYFSEK